MLGINDECKGSKNFIFQREKSEVENLAEKLAMRRKSCIFAAKFAVHYVYTRKK